MKFNRFLVCVLPVLLIGILYAVKNVYQEFTSNIFMPCWFNVCTGYLCPGCGGTRSFYALLEGDVLRSFKYNAFVPVIAIFGIITYCRLFLKVVCNRHIGVFPKDDRFIYIPLIIFLIYFVVRNFYV